MKDMIFTFTTNMGPDVTAEAIKATIREMGGVIKESSGSFVGKFRIPRKWKPAFHTLFRSRCRFYVGKNGVRAVLRVSNTIGYSIGEHNPIAEERVWDSFIRMFLALYPKCGINIRPGTINFDTVTVHDGPDIYRYESVERSSPSLTGAIAGGMIAGDAGAIIGASYGKSTVSGSIQAERNPYVRIIGRYTNGCIQDTKLLRNSAIYHEILVNFDTSPK